MQGASGDRDNGFSLPLLRHLVSQLTKILFRRIDTKFCEPSSYYLVRGEIRNNTAKGLDFGGGGAIYAVESNLQVYGGSLNNNVADDAAGGPLCAAGRGKSGIFYIAARIHHPILRQ